ncbi:hypothetical protein GJ744_008812 [Endocarpon pusillum]|uniref:Uncharacterized protein n=1 Tax=Endocarpon pusillum TaxID=364733 RepID=A0A8H7AQK0_9EURO|nr:hypothetical protein GJ744_008812 [Endocarpon pusillum]
MLGETILTLFHIYNRYRGDLQSLAAGEIVQFKPTLIVCPAGVVDFWFGKWSSHFRDKLNLIQFYGQDKMYPWSSPLLIIGLQDHNDWAPPRGVRLDKLQLR